MREKITFKDKLSYLLKIMEGKFTPFLQNELNDDEIKKVFLGLQNRTDVNDYQKLLHNYLNKYYEFEKDIYLTNSGRDALYFILLNLKLKKKEIIIPSYSCLGLIEPILQLKYKPVFIDIDHQLNPLFESVEKAISPETSAVIIPHLGGTIASDTFKIIEICKYKKITVIEDCCQAFGLKFKKKPIGTFSDISFFSSGAGKPIFTPCGDWIVTKKNKFRNFEMTNLIDEKIQKVYSNYVNFKNKFSNQRFRIIKSRLIDKFYSVFVKSQKFFYIKMIQDKKHNLSNLSAYMILNQIEKNEKNILTRKKIANIWMKKLKNINNIEVLNKANSIFNKLYINSNLSNKKSLLLQGIELENGYIPLHLRYDFSKFQQVSLTNTERIWRRIYSLPVRRILNQQII